MLKLPFISISLLILTACNGTKEEVNLQKVLKSSSTSSRGMKMSDDIDIFKSNIVYTVVSKDYNLNNELDEDDPNYLYVSDKEGNNFRQISPEDCHIISWDIVKGTSKIIMQGQLDENGDKKFDVNDRIIPFIVDLKSMNPAAEIFDSSYVNTLKQKLVTIWKPKVK